jgi:hypothetical protein
MRTWLLLVLLVGTLTASPTAPRPAGPLERRDTFWPGGHLKTSGTYLHDVRQGEYRTWRENGTPYELRHYDRGHESGLQQSWDEDGRLFLNYEMRGGRRYGFVNATPCLPAGADGTSSRRPS